MPGRTVMSVMPSSSALSSGSRHYDWEARCCHQNNVPSFCGPQQEEGEAKWNIILTSCSAPEGIHSRGGSAGIWILYTYITSFGDIRYDNQSYGTICSKLCWCKLLILQDMGISGGQESTGRCNVRIRNLYTHTTSSGSIVKSPSYPIMLDWLLCLCVC